jgi:membrane protease YdiL (CAAX protease family)
MLSILTIFALQTYDQFTSPMRESIQSSHPIIQLLVFLLFGFIAMIVLAGIALIPFLIAGYGIETLGAGQSLSESDTGAIFMLKVMQMAQAVGLFIVPYLMYRWLLKEDEYKVFSLPYVGVFSALIFGAAMFSAFPLINFLASWNADLTFPIESIDQWIQKTETGAEHLIKLFLATDSAAGLVFNLVLIALIPAVGEELLFRGTVQPLMLKSFKGNYHLAIWVTAFWFSFIHLQFLGFFPRLLLGAILGYAAHWSGSLILPMIGHFTNNALAVLVAYFIGLDALDSDAEMIGSTSDQLQLVLMSSVLLVGGMFLVYRDSNFRANSNLEA